MRQRRGLPPVLLGLSIAFGGFASCALPEPVAVAPHDDPPVAPPETATVHELTSTEQLNRASMVLRGLRPSLAELEAVRADPTALDGIVAGYVDDPNFGPTMRDLHNDTWHLRATSETHVPASGSLAGVDMSRLRTSLYESPLHTIEWVITHDRPYTEILSADYMLADDVVARAWSHLDGYDNAAGGWQPLHWTDGRPNAGILSDNLIYMRYASMGDNYERGRANVISRALLCNDFLDREIVLDGAIDLADPAVVADAVTQDEACATCHRTLDPLASFLPYRTSFALYLQEWPTEMYLSDWVQTEGWRQATRQPPAYFGTPGETLGDLAAYIAADPRFSLCTATRFYAWMTETPRDEIPPAIAAELQDEFVASGFDAKALALAVARRPEFRQSHSDDDALAAGIVGLQKARPEQSKRMMEDLTGFVWQTSVDTECCLSPAGTSRIGLVDVQTDAWNGYQTLSGGIDGAYASVPVYTANATSTLVLRQYAAEAAGWVVPHDLDEPDRAARRLLTLVDDDTTSEAEIRAQLVALHTRLYAEFVADDDPSVAAAWTVWNGAWSRTHDTRHAWMTTLTAMLQDWRMMYY